MAVFSGAGVLTQQQMLEAWTSLTTRMPRYEALVLGRWLPLLSNGS